MALKDILANGSKYADDMVLTLPDGTTATVGEMRTMEADEKRNLIQRSQVMDQAEVALAERIREAQSKGILSTTPTDDATIRREAATQFGLSEDDPLLGQVAKEFKRLEAENKASQAAMQAQFKTESDALKGILGKVTGAYLNDFYATRFDNAAAKMPADVRAKVKLEDALKYAEEHRLMDKAGRYDIDSSLDRLTWDARKEAEMATLRADAKTKAEREAQMATMNRPSPNALRSKQAVAEGFDPFNKDGKVKSFDEALAEAANDDALLNSIASTASGFGPN